MTYDVPIALNNFGDTAAVWSGVNTDTEALVRTVAFDAPVTVTVEAFGRAFELPCRREGSFYRLRPDGTQQLVSTEGAR